MARQNKNNLELCYEPLEVLLLTPTGEKLWKSNYWNNILVVSLCSGNWNVSETLAFQLRKKSEPEEYLVQYQDMTPKAYKTITKLLKLTMHTISASIKKITSGDKL